MAGKNKNSAVTVPTGNAVSAFIENVEPAAKREDAKAVSYTHLTLPTKA